MEVDGKEITFFLTGLKVIDQSDGELFSSRDFIS